MGDAMTNYNDGKWWGWNGGECPVHPETVVDVVYEGGHVAKNLAKNIAWDHANYQINLVAFRVIKEYKEPVKPREVWLAETETFSLDNPTVRKSGLAFVLPDTRGARLFREVLPD